MTRFLFDLVYAKSETAAVRSRQVFLIRLQRPMTSFNSPKTIAIKHVVSVAYLFRQHGNEAYWIDHYKKLRDRFGFSSSLKNTDSRSEFSWDTEKLIMSRPVDITIRQSLSVDWI